MPTAATPPSPKKTEPKKKESEIQATPAQKSDRPASRTRLRVLASIPAPRLERGSDQAAPPVRELMALNRYDPPQQDGRPSFWERPSHALPDRKGTHREVDASRLRSVGGVNGR